MDEELDPNIIKTTQSILGKYVKRPQLSEKLLKKPPFRFLHDIITTVLKTTGFFEGLFENSELISDNVKDRESKIQFLNKVIAVLNIATGKQLSVKPSKIVAGQEPRRTNELLQCLGQALEQKLSSNEAVKKYKESIKSTTSVDHEKVVKESLKSTKKNVDNNKFSSKSNEKLSKNEKESKTTTNLKTKENSLIRKESPSKRIQNKATTKKNVSNKVHEPKEINKKETKIQQSRTDQNVNISGNTESEKSVEATVNEIEQGYKQNEVAINDNLSKVTKTPHINHEIAISHEIEKKEQFDSLNISVDTGSEIIVEKSEDTQIYNDDFKSSTQQEKKDKTIINVKEPTVQKSTTEQIQVTKNIHDDKNKYHDTKENTIDSNSNSNISSRPVSVRPSSSRPGAPRIRDKHENISAGTENILVGKVNIIAENTFYEEDGDTSVLIIDSSIDAFSKTQNEEQMLSTLTQHGHLVQQILDSQKEFSQVSGKTEVEWQFGAQKTRDIINQEYEQLRINVQALSRVSNPLGKLLDHIQEDVEVMRQELQEWVKKYEDAAKEISKQKTSNEELLLPLYAKITQLNADIVEKRDKINDLKVVIYKNYNKIEKLLGNGSVQ